MPVSDPLTTTFFLPSVPPGPPVVGTIPNDKVPATLGDFDLPLHLNIRDFRRSLKPLQLSLADLNYHSVQYWETLNVAEMASTDAPSVGDENWLTYGLLQNDLNLLTQAQLDLTNQSQLESAAGIGLNPVWNYSPGISVSVPVGGRRFTSTFNHDNLLQTPFNDPARQYFIELVLRDFPAQFGSPTFNHTTSYVSFSTSTNNAVGQTVQVPFSASLTSISAGGNVVWRINRDTLNSIDITNIQRIDFYLVAVGGTATFKAEAMRLVADNYPYYAIGIDTKTGYLAKNSSQIGTNTQAQVQPPAVMNVGTNKAVNFSEIIKFNAGHHPTNPLYNQMSIYLRATPGSGEYVEVALNCNNLKTLVQIYEGGTGVYQVEGAALVEGNNYFLEIGLSDSRVRIVVWNSVGNYPTDVVLNTDTAGIVTVGRVQPGWVAYNLFPQNSDFVMDYMFAREAAIGEVITKGFESNTPVKGVTLYSTYSPPKQILDQGTGLEGPAINLLRKPVKDSGADNGDFVITPGVNDVTVSLDTNIIFEYPNPYISTLGQQASFKVRKQLRNALIGGVQWNDTVKINDPLNATIRGAVRFDSFLNYGNFRVVMFDKFWENVAFTSVIDVNNLVLGKWNEFEIPMLNETIYNNEFKIQFQHVGVNTSKSYTDANAVGTFWLDGFRVETDTVVWEASNDNGLTWMRFFDTIGSQYQGVNFPELNNQLKIKARAFDTTGWVNSFQAIVNYSQPGRILE